jgi:VRR-NUC domain
MTHAELLAAIQLACSKGGTRLFKINAGQAWQGRIVSRSAALLTLADYRAIQLAPEGVSDLIGFRGGQFVAIEAKTGRGRLTPEQSAFIDLVGAYGGRAGVARSVEDAARILGIIP